MPRIFFFILLSTGILSCKQEISFPEGGYNYPVDLFDNQGEGFRMNYINNFFLQSFKEQPLHTSPEKQITIRLEIIRIHASIITVTKKEIVVKQSLKGHCYPDFDLSKLTATELIHFSMIDRMPKMTGKKKMTLSKDSMVKLYPQLLSNSYYKYLLDKAQTPDGPFIFSVKHVAISENTFYRLLDKINTSGYWHLPLSTGCEPAGMDGWGFSLEVNTPLKYNLVSLSSCPNRLPEFTKACQAIIDEADPDMKINLMAGDGLF